MSPSVNYRAAISRVREHVRSSLSGAEGARNTGVSTMYEYARTNLLHILKLTDAAENAELAARVVEEVLINRNVDHTAQFLPDLTEAISVHDPSGVLDRVREKVVYLFVGFHTGPYMCVGTALLRSGARVTALLPPALQGRKTEMMQTFNGVIAHLGVDTDVKFLDIGGPNFLIHMRRHVRDGRQLLVYVDGYGGYTAKANGKNDVEIPFFSASVLAKSTLARLSYLLDTPMVVASARRGDDMEITLYIDAPLNMRESAERLVHYTCQDATVALFSRLASRIALSPSQWEGWIYFHTFLSPRYLNQIRDAKVGMASWNTALGKFFMHDSSIGRVVVNRLTYECYKAGAARPLHQDEIRVVG